MTTSEEQIVDATRRLVRSLKSKLVSKGVEPADAAIGLAYALHDAATDVTGDPSRAVEFIRRAADTFEVQLNREATHGKPTAH